MSQKNLREFGKDGKMLGGGAAQLHFIKRHGGWDQFLEDYGTAVGREATRIVQEEMYRPELKLVKDDEESA